MGRKIIKCLRRKSLHLETRPSAGQIGSDGKWFGVHRALVYSLKMGAIPRTGV